MTTTGGKSKSVQFYIVHCMQTTVSLQGYPSPAISTSQTAGMDSSPYRRPSLSVNRNFLDSSSIQEPFNDSSPASAAQSLSKSDSPQPELPRLSSDSTAPTSPTLWHPQDPIPIIQRSNTTAHDIPFQNSTAGLETLDDTILRALCDLDVRQHSLLMACYYFANC